MVQFIYAHVSSCLMGATLYRDRFKHFVHNQSPILTCCSPNVGGLLQCLLFILIWHSLHSGHFHHQLMTKTDYVSRCVVASFVRLCST